MLVCIIKSPGFAFYREDYQDVHACVCVTLEWLLETLLLTWDIIRSFFFLSVSLEVMMFFHCLSVQLSSFSANN